MPAFEFSSLDGLGGGGVLPLLIFDRDLGVIFWGG